MQQHYFIHPSSFADEGCFIGDGTKIWHFCHIMEKAVIGENCNIGQNVFVGNLVRLGNGVKVQNNVSLYEGIICEDDVFIGPSVVFTNVKNPRAAIVRRAEFQTTYIKKGATIGANATILCGVTIGMYAFVGAGSVVTKNIPAYALLVGNPAKQIGWVSRAGHRLHFNEKQQAVCPETQELYEKTANSEVKIVI